MRYFFPSWLTFFLLGCTSVPVTPKFPDVPEDLRYTCPDLAQIQQEDPKLSDVINTVTDNYITYYECKIKVDAWIRWYDQQKKIYNSIK
jgi:hypothetical protein